MQVSRAGERVCGGGAGGDGDAGREGGACQAVGGWGGARGAWEGFISHVALVMFDEIGNRGWTAMGGILLWRHGIRSEVPRPENRQLSKGMLFPVQLQLRRAEFFHVHCYSCNSGRGGHASCFCCQEAILEHAAHHRPLEFWKQTQRWRAGIVTLPGS